MGNAGWNLVGAWLITLLTAGPVPLAAIDSGPVDSQGANTTISRIRTADPDIARAIARAAEWSQTFRRLVEAIERTDGLVWVSRDGMLGDVSGRFRTTSAPAHSRRPSTIG
jgi:hypothetical protein